MFELKSMTYEENRKEYFEELKADAVRKMEYWSKRVDKDGPWDPRARANVHASEWGAVVSYLNDALKALEVMPKEGDMRLIDADALVKGLELMARYQPEHKQSTILGVCATIKATHTIDAEAVRHGRWIEDMYFDEPVTRCTWCNHGFAKGHKAKRFPYCPHCGAKMGMEVQE